MSRTLVAGHKRNNTRCLVYYSVSYNVSVRRLTTVYHVAFLACLSFLSSTLESCGCYASSNPFPILGTVTFKILGASRIGLIEL